MDAMFILPCSAAGCVETLLSLEPDLEPAVNRRYRPSAHAARDTWSVLCAPKRDTVTYSTAGKEAHMSSLYSFSRKEVALADVAYPDILASDPRAQSTVCTESKVSHLGTQPTHRLRQIIQKNAVLLQYYAGHKLGCVLMQADLTATTTSYQTQKVRNSCVYVQGHI